MAVSYISSSSNKSATTSVVVTAPASLQNGDIMIMIVNSFRSTSATPGAHAVSGWTQIYTRATSTRYIFSIWYKRCASESGNYTATSTSSLQMEAAIAVYRGCVSSGTPVDVSSNTAYVTSSTIVRGATITPTVADGFFVWGGFFYLATGNTLTKPTALTLRETQQNTNNTITLADLAYSTTSASGNQDGTSGATATVKHAYLLALKPAVPKGITADVGALTVTGFAPVKSINKNVTADAGAFTIAGFEPVASTSGGVSPWKAKPLKWYNGSVWVEKPLKAYVGGSWVTKLLKAYSSVSTLLTGLVSYWKLDDDANLLGTELCIDPGFDNASLWNCVGGFTISGSKLRVTDTWDGYLTDMDALDFAAAHTYRVTYTIESYTDGWIQMYMAGGVGTHRTSAGTYTEDIFTSGASPVENLYFQSENETNLIIDNVSVKEVSLNNSIIDSVGGFNGTNNGFTQGISGKIGNGLQGTTASNEYATFGNHSEHDAPAFTWAFWYYPTNLTGYHNIIEKADNNTQGLQIITLDDSILFTLGYNYVNQTISGTLVINQWHHIICTFGGAGTNMNMYINNSLADSLLKTYGYSSAAFNLTFGYPADNGHCGVLDEVLMWNRVLTSDERAELFALTTPLL